MLIELLIEISLIPLLMIENVHAGGVVKSAADLVRFRCPEVRASAADQTHHHSGQKSLIPY